MRVRLLAVLLLVSGSALVAQTPTPPPSPQPAPQGQQPVFRTGVEILTVDATVVDRDGKQIVDLKANEFEVDVDGDPRPVVSAEYVKLADDTPIPVGARKPPPPKVNPDDAFFSTNARTLVAGRTIVILVDQGNIRVGQGRLMMRSAVKFVDGLMPSDRIAMIAIPQGALVDFTTDHEKVREALLATVGLATAYKGRYHISLSEAIATVEHSDSTLINQLFQRECGGALMSAIDVARCEIEVEQEAGEMVNHQRIQTQASLRGMREVLKSLAGVEGPKSVILISEGLVLEGLTSDVDDIAAIAADVRASLDVMLLDVPSVDVTESQRPTTPREDRDRQVQGLEALAGLSRGALHRIISSGDNAFQRVTRSIAGHYLIGVEARPRDRDGKRHRISVKTIRRGATLYSRRGFLAPTSPEATTPADAIAKALRAPLTMNDIPLRMATWTYKEPGGSRVRLLITVEAERGEAQSLDYTTGLVVVDRNNKAVASAVEKRALVRSAIDPGRAVFVGSLMVDPGTYLLRLAFADSEGRLGSIDRKVDAWQMNAAGLTVGDLLIGQAPTDATTTISPSIEPQVSNGRLAAVMEVYSPQLQTLQDLKATIEIVPNENARPLTSSPMVVTGGKTQEVGILLSAVNTTALPPGRYFAKASITLAGKPQGHILRPFTVLPASADGSAAVMPSTLPAELLASLLATLPTVDRKELLEPTVLNAVLGAAEKARPTAKTAFASARGGKIGPAALDALASGDQVTAAFLRGVDLFAQGQTERAMQQLQLAMQGAPGFAPARLYLGAALAQSNRHREAASLLQSVTADVAGPAPVARMTGLSWLHAGDASNAIAVLEKAPPGAGDTSGTRTLALAYIVANRPIDAMPLLVKYLETNPADQEALLAGIYASYATHAPRARAETLATDRAHAQTWAKAYAAKKGAHQPLVDAWMAYLQGAK